MPIKDFSEKLIRRKIIAKLEPRLHRGGKHDKAYIYHDDVLLAKVKLPNEHAKVMKASKSQYICTGLRLAPDDFNKLIECQLHGSDYYEMLLRNVEDER